MKNRSKITAIIVSLCLAGSAQANPWNWFAPLITVNVMQVASTYVLPWANIYLTYRNGQKIDGLDRKVTELGTQIAGIDGKVTALDGKVTVGFAGLKTQVSGLQAALGQTNTKIDKVEGVVNAHAQNFAEFKTQYGQDMAGVHTRLDSVQSSVDDHRGETAAQLQALNGKADKTLTDLAELKVMISRLAGGSSVVNENVE
jgi:hypothetical protein